MCTRNERIPDIRNKYDVFKNLINIIHIKLNYTYKNVS